MIEQRRIKDYDPESSLADDARMRQLAIGVRLRQLFDDVVNEPVPEEFLDILRNADKRSTEGS